MSSPNLINIDVDKLFEQHNVLEIDQIQKRLQTEVESKREELRIMVGERYRDLLQAADTIFQMKDTSQQVNKQISNISGNCKNINEMQLFGFKANTDSYKQQIKKKSNKQLTTFYSTTVQTKILTMLHELICQRLDNEEFFLAAQLYILARHIHTGLQLDNENYFTLYFPIGKTHWDMMEKFSKMIKEMVFNVLEREEITAELTTDCLLSLYILDKLKLNEILIIFVEHRCTAFLNSLASDEIKKRRIKDRILASLKILITTLSIIFKCFLNNENNGLIFMELEKFSNIETPPTISLIEFNDPLMFATVPDIISKFKPSFEKPILTQETIQNVSEIWLKSVNELTNSHLKNIIELITSMKTIQDLKRESLAIEKDSRWPEMCVSFNLPKNLDLYKEKYKPLINERIQDIIRQSWTKSISQSFDKITNTLNTTATTTATQRNQNKNSIEFSYLWMENSADIPISLKQALSQNKTNNKLLMKTKGFTIEIVEICIEFDSLLKEIFAEMKVLLEETDNKFENKQLLLEFLGETSLQHTIELITKIKCLNFDMNYENYAIVAKLFIAFIDLCPNFKLCLSYTPQQATDSNDKQNVEKWNRVCDLLDEESFVMWKKFCDLIFQEYLKNGMALKTNLGHKTMLEDLVNWETITIEENDEHEIPITSTIRIPSQPRISLQTFLFNFIKLLTQKIPQTLPPKVLNYLTKILIQYLLQHFELLIETEFIKTNQNLSLQLYFDIKFLQLIFFENCNDHKLIEIYQKIINSLKAFIDPVDFELFYSHLCCNIKNCASRMYQKLGILIINSENLILLADNKNQLMNNSLDKDPNVLILSCSGANSTWFPLLPVVIPADASKSLQKLEMEKQNVTKSKRNIVTDQKLTTTSTTTATTSIMQPSTSSTTTAQTVKSGAAAFFGAMGQDWFR